MPSSIGNEIEAPLERVPLERHDRQPDARSPKFLFARRATAPNANLGPLQLGIPLLILFSSVCFIRTDIEHDHECRHHLHNADTALFGNRPSGGALTSPCNRLSLVASRIKRRTGSSYF